MNKLPIAAAMLAILACAPLALAAEKGATSIVPLKAQAVGAACQEVSSRGDRGS
jgi:hypothetical protein